ncbi:MAG: hypothetical protein B7Y02_02035 [Rhodobacterales bacterium 17-64-5]|nr:MAG: hypothetical protein B7Y02_02035 [Rhodobacterales bacterium 17-64-5]
MSDRSTKRQSASLAEMVELTAGEQACIIINILTDFASEPARLVKFCEHVGFDLSALTTTTDLIPAWLGHYRIKRGVYDVDRACKDLATWPPIAAMIAKELRGKSRAV